MAGGSQILINDKGITISTGGEILYQAGQHKFEKGKQVKSEMMPLPIVNEVNTFTNKWDFYDLFYETRFANVQYKLINSKNNTYVSGHLDQHGRTQRLHISNNENHDILIGANTDWSVSMDDGSEYEHYEYNCSCGAHDHEDDI